MMTAGGSAVVRHGILVDLRVRPPAPGSLRRSSEVVGRRRQVALRQDRGCPVGDGDLEVLLSGRRSCWMFALSDRGLAPDRNRLVRGDRVQLVSSAVLAGSEGLSVPGWVQMVALDRRHPLTADEVLVAGLESDERPVLTRLCVDSHCPLMRLIPPDYLRDHDATSNLHVGCIIAEGPPANRRNRSPSSRTQRPRRTTAALRSAASGGPSDSHETSTSSRKSGRFAKPQLLPGSVLGRVARITHRPPLDLALLAESGWVPWIVRGLNLRHRWPGLHGALDPNRRPRAAGRAASMRRSPRRSRSAQTIDPPVTAPPTTAAHQSGTTDAVGIPCGGRRISAMTAGRGIRVPSGAASRRAGTEHGQSTQPPRRRCSSLG